VILNDAAGAVAREVAREVARIEPLQPPIPRGSQPTKPATRLRRMGSPDRLVAIDRDVAIRMRNLERGVRRCRGKGFRCSTR
jgi:hypothetical protein